MKDLPAQPVPQCHLPITVCPHYNVTTLQWSRVSAWRSPLHCLACLARLLAEPDDAKNKANSSNLHVQELPTQPFDFIFVDHIKSAYVSDLELLVQKGFVKKGTVVVADNMWLPGRAAPTA